MFVLPLILVPIVFLMALARLYQIPAQLRSGRLQLVGRGRAGLCMATLLAYANKKIEDLDNRRKTLSKAIADLSVETLSSQQIELLSGYLDDWENISFEDKRKAADGLISSISATSDYVKIEWKI